jgi:hypothetical protein
MSAIHKILYKFISAMLRSCREWAGVMWRRPLGRHRCVERARLPGEARRRVSARLKGGRYNGSIDFDIPVEVENLSSI